MKQREDAPAGTSRMEKPSRDHPAGVEALEAIRVVADTLHETLEFDVIAERAIESILAYAPFVAASVFSLSESEDQLELVAARGFHDELLQSTTTLSLDTSLAGYALQEGRVVLSDDLAVETRGVAELRAALIRDGYNRALIVPLIHRSNKLGTLNIVLREGYALTGRDRATLLSIGQAVALALANARYVERLRRSELRYAMAAVAGKVTVWDLDVKTDVLHLDPSVAELLGVSHAEIPADLEAWLARVPDEDRRSLHDQIRDCADGRTTEFSCEHRLVREDGTAIWVLARGTGVHGDDGTVIRLIGTDVDITERKRLEATHRDLREQLIHAEKLKSLGVLAGGIAHDFNNLLTTVLGNADLALDQLPDGAPVRKSIRRIETAVRRGAELTRQLLAYSGKGAFVIKPIDLSQMVSELGGLLGVSISKKAILHYELAENLPAIEADAGQLQQVVMNLMTNASDALGERGGTIRLRTGVAELPDRDPSDPTDDPLPGGSYVFLEVTDDGEGMDDDVRSRIFNPFYTTKLWGRGLGLAAVQGIVRGHRGGLRVESQPGTGTIVTVLLPASGAVVVEPEAAPPALPEDFGDGTVLVVDDEDGVRELATTVLQAAGFKVLTARDGREAVERFGERSDEITVVLLDLTMPQMSGQEALAKIREIRPDARVVLSSGYPESEAVFEGHGTEPVHVLQKPYDSAQLLERIRQAIGR